MEKLPSKVLAQIFENLPKGDIYKAVSLVCKDWLNILQSFNLIKCAALLLKEPFSYYCNRIKEDFKTYPTFGNKVESIHIRYLVNLNYITENSMDDFYSLAQSCPNVEVPTLLTNKFQLVSDILAVILTNERSFKLKLNTVVLFFFNLSDSGIWHLTEPAVTTNSETIDLKKLVNHDLPCLNKLCITSFYDISERKRLIFANNDLQPKINNMIHTIDIASPFNLMTRSCLEYLISGNLVNLKHLKLYLTLVDWIDEHGNSVEMHEEDNIIFDKLKNFCLLSLKKYDICIRKGYNLRPVKFSNCKDNERLNFEDSKNNKVNDKEDITQ